LLREQTTFSFTATIDLFIGGINFEYENIELKNREIEKSGELKAKWGTKS
jgi:hypothetical protein